MNITKPLTGWKNDKAFFEYTTYSGDDALDLGFSFMVPINLELGKQVLSNHSVLLTNTDYVSHDDCIERLRENVVVVLYSEIGNQNTNQASVTRLKKAKQKLESKGIKVKYFASRKTAENYIRKLKGE